MVGLKTVLTEGNSDLHRLALRHDANNFFVIPLIAIVV